MAIHMRIVALLALAFTVSDIHAQSRGDRDRDSDGRPVWVGGVISNNLRFGGGTFSFGVTPMAGYEIVPKISVGPFIRMDYYYERIPVSANSYVRYSTLDVGPGIFARADIFRQVFVQVEYERGYLKRETYDSFGNLIIVNGKVQKETVEQNFVYLGAGYTSGTSIQYGISLHYNVLDDAFSPRFPWDYRINLRVPLNGRSR